MGKEKWGKSSKLKSFSAIRNLFENGNDVTDYPVKIVFQKQEEIKLTQAGFSVSKKRFKNAVDRNRIKRQLREAFRKNKNELSEDSKYQLMVLYIGKEQVESVIIDKKVKKLLNEISQKEQK